MGTLIIIVILIVFYVLHNAYKKYRKIHLNEIKGPTPIPILGNLHQLSKSPHIDITNMSNKYGGLTRIWLADIYTVIISDPVLIREVYVDNFENFMNRPKVPSMEHATHFHGTLTAKDDDWRRNREVVSIALKKTNIKHIYLLLDEQVDILIESMKSIEVNGEQFDLRYYLTKYTMSVMFKYIFNITISKEEDIKSGDISRLMKPLQQVFKDSSTGSLFDVLEICKPFYMFYLEHINNNFIKILNYSREHFNEHLKDYDPNVQRDLLDTLIKEYGDKKEDDILWILSTVSIIFTAGVDTSSTSIEIMMLLLANYPEIQEKSYQQIKESINGRSKVKLEDRQSMPYVVAMMKESIRYMPVSSMGIPRTTRNDCMIGGKFIPKDTQILINYHALSQNEQYWDNPKVFDPNRFLKSETNLAYIPFSVGPRNCVGENLAKDEMFLAISNILLNFKIKSVDGKQIDETQCYGISLKPNPFKVLLEKRK